MPAAIHSSSGPRGHLDDAHILLVDDHEELVSTLMEILEDEGAHVTPAYRGSEALARADAGFDVAVVDINLPDGSGLRVLPGLKRAGDGFGEIVLITSEHSLQTAVAAVGREAYAYVLKPFNPAIFTAMVGRALAKVRLRRSSRELEARMRVAEKLAMIGPLTAGLGRRLNSSLAAVAETLARIEDGVQARMPEGDLLDPIFETQAEVRRLASLTDDLLDFAGLGLLERAPIDLALLAARVVEMFQAEASESGVEVEGALPAAEFVVWGDERKLRLVLCNVVRNAIEALEHTGGRVELSLVWSEAQVASLQVRDDGPGIAADILPRVFEPFFSTKAMSTGLGMAISHSLVELHGGTLWIHSGPGTLVEIRLPVGTPH